jgi:Trk K+ transport system NAD-binding subunit
MQMPITVVAFIVETSLHPETIIFMMIAVFAGILTAEALHTKPLNEITLKRFMKVADRDRIWHLYQVQGKILPDAFVVGKTVRDVLWPANTLIKELVQDDQANITNVAVHGGDRVLAQNDRVVFMIQSYNINAVIEDLNALLGNQTFSIEEQSLIIK